MDLPLRTTRSEGARSSLSVARVLIAAAYAVLSAVLVVSRLAHLNHGFWLDEAVFVKHFVREGPREILFGGVLSHELYGVLDWATASAVGESAIAFRLWSAIPFVLGVALVTIWLHRRHDPIAGVLFLVPRDRLAAPARHIAAGARVRARIPGHGGVDRGRAGGEPVGSSGARGRVCAAGIVGT